MTADLIQYASISGELAKNLWGRSDFQKYDAGWARAHNWFVDYRGGLFNRAGFAFGDFIEWTDGHAIKFFEFQYSPDQANTYLIIFTDDKIRFVQDNAYVLEDAKTVSNVALSGGDVRITSTAHGYVTGELIKLAGFTDADLTFLNGMTAFVEKIDDDNIELTSVIDSTTIGLGSLTYTSGGSLYRVYTVTSPYGQEDLDELQITQIRDFLRLTHTEYPIKNLVRNDVTDWTLANESTSNSIERPSNIVRNAVSSSSSATVLYQITAVDENGNESLPAWHNVDDFDNGPNFSSAAHWIRLSWNGTTTAVYYNVYRSRAVDSNANTMSDMEFGYIGKSWGTMFIDRVTTPDFSKKPPQEGNPFANAAVKFVQITNEGSGYDLTAEVDDPAGGTGFLGYFVRRNNSSVSLNGVKVISGGQDYTGTAVGVTGGGAGVDFAATAHLTAASGNYPGCSAIFQQRQMYAGTLEMPLGLFGSRPGLFSNFDFSDVNADDDAYDFELDAEKVSAIRHIIPMRAGVLVFNQVGVWYLYGRGNTGLNGNTAQAEIQGTVGATFAKPVYVESYVLYVTDTANELHMMVYDDYAKAYQSRNISMLSNHLFGAEYDITSLTYTSTPFKTVAVTQSNGRLILLTIDSNNDVFAACPQWTKGKFEYGCKVTESGRNRLYVAVRRIINGNVVLFFERMHTREFATLEEAFFVDAGLSTDRTYPAATLTPSSLTGSVTFSASAAVFASGDVGKIIRCGTGKATITTFNSSTEVVATWTRDLADVEPESTSPKIFAANEWTMDATFTTVSGLWHLEGEDVTILADGEVVTGKTVSSGALTLDTAASVVHVGLAYTSIAQTLPPTASDVVIEGRRKNIKGIAFRINETYGVKTGATLDKLYEIHDRAKRLWSTASRLRDEMVHEIVASHWSLDNQLYIVQDSPRPAGILNFIRDTELGDDKD